MEKTEKHYITIITKENTEPVKIVENAKIGFNDKMYQTNEFGISIIEIKNLEVIEGQNPFTLGIKKEGYEDIVFEREFYNKRGKIKIITLRKKQKRIPNITITTKIEGTPNIINSEIGQFINGEKIIKNK